MSNKPRVGYFITNNHHQFFNKSVVDSIHLRAKKVISKIEEQFNISLPTIDFRIYRHVESGRNLKKIAQSIFRSQDEMSDVRFIYSIDFMPADVLREYYNNQKLIVEISQYDNKYISIEAGSCGDRSCKIRVGDGQKERIIEDIIIDITLGNYFASKTPILQLISSEALAGLYKRKARFCRDNKFSARVLTSKSATYSVLSSNNNINDEDINERAREAYSLWDNFIKSVTINSSNPMIMDGSNLDSIRNIPYAGGQISIKKLNKAFSVLENGEYIIIILRKARKTPALRNKVSALFPRFARLNSFVVLSDGQYITSKNIVDDLMRSGHIIAVPYSHNQ